jgi:nitrite reductase (NADH) small subunit
MVAVPRLVRVASVDEIPVGRSKTVEVDGLSVAVFNAGREGFHALGGICPHEGGPLGEGAVVGDMAVCPWHGYDFDLRSGVCGVDPELSVGTYPVRVEGADVLLELP